MKKWQKERNYRRIYDGNGRVIANIITVDGVDVEVTEEVFRIYSQMDRRERYLEEQTWKPGTCTISLEYLKEQDVSIGLYVNECAPSAEDIVLQEEKQKELLIHKEKLKEAFVLLRKDEQKLIQALFFDELSTREYAHKQGVTQHAIIKRRDRVLTRLKNFLKKF